MQNVATFTVYNASAGSGKTYTLVKEYLKVVLRTENAFAYQQILAITFTNKAAAEMKERVLKSLQDFTERKESELLNILISELTLNEEIIRNRSTKILHAILQNYSAFQITTIDSFTYKIIKSFSFDLGVSQNFEIELNANDLLSQAVEVIISRIGIDTNLTKLLVAYTLGKTDEDKSWDISRELCEFSNVLLNENDAVHFKKLHTKTVDDFLVLNKHILTSQKKIKKRFKEVGREGLEIIDAKGLSHKDFYCALLPKHFSALADTVEKANFFDASKLKVRIEENIFYAKAVAVATKNAIEEILPKLIKLYLESENLYKQYMLNKLVMESVVPLAVLNQINEALQTLKEEQNIQLNAEFNQLIYENIKEQPAPYIYERIGQKFTHYFIDEMQDTSVLQWQNLLPLIQNSLSQENTSLLLVGDAKQAIYRWRGGKAEQFMALGSEEKHTQNPFFVSKKVKKLAYNYRSYSEIINFNNSFFKHCSGYMRNDAYKSLFLHTSHQKETDKKGGYVHLSFLEKSGQKEENDVKYAKKVFGTIQDLKVSFSLNDICILVRTKKEGVIIANYLSEKGIKIVSSETLLIQNSHCVNFIINLLGYSLQPTNNDALFECLYFLHEHIPVPKNKHSFFKRYVHLGQEKLFEELKKHEIHFDLSIFKRLPLYEKVEYIIRSFRLLKTSDAHVQFLLDEVLLQQGKDATIRDFLDFWEREKKNISIVASKDSDAVQVMTIHKSKGLEFPVVIFPCDLDIYKQPPSKIWLTKLPEEKFSGFEEFLVNYKKEIAILSENGEQIHIKEQDQLELDNINLLYVALTRAEEQLYIITEKGFPKNQKKSQKYSDFYTNYLIEKSIYDPEKEEYSFGTPNREREKEVSQSKLSYQKKYINTPWQDHHIHILGSSSVLWDTKDAIDYGNLIHELMAKIYTASDVVNVVNSYKVRGMLNNEEAFEIQSIIEKMVTHKKLKNYYIPHLEVYNEREMITRDNQIVVPDKLVIFPNEEVVIIDYKTGKPSEDHHHQLLKYQEAIQSMNYTVVKKILIYISNEIGMEEF